MTRQTWQVDSSCLCFCILRRDRFRTVPDQDSRAWKTQNLHQTDMPPVSSGSKAALSEGRWLIHLRLICADRNWAGMGPSTSFVFLPGQLTLAACWANNLLRGILKLDLRFGNQCNLIVSNHLLASSISEKHLLYSFRHINGFKEGRPSVETELQAEKSGFTEKSPVNHGSSIECTVLRWARVGSRINIDTLSITLLLSLLSCPSSLSCPSLLLCF